MSNRSVRGSAAICVMVSVIFLAVSPPASVAQDPIPQEVENLQKAKETLQRVVKLLQFYVGAFDSRDFNRLGPKARTGMLKFSNRAEEILACLESNAILAADASTKIINRDPERIRARRVFKGRFDQTIRRELFGLDEMGECGASDLLLEPRLSEGDPRVIHCCREELDQDLLVDHEEKVLEPEFALAEALVATWEEFTAKTDFLTGAIAENSRILEQFDRKLIDGFPGMPWEYVFNMMGDINGPSPHQIIWAHFNLGFEDGVQVAPGDNRIQPVLTLQGLGYNRYFLSKDKGVWRKLNYLGVAGIITLNGRKGVTAVRYGGVVHFGNYVSVGSTYGDGAWRVYASSNKVVDQILKIWN